MSEMDKEPLWIFLSATSFLAVLGYILSFLINWVIIASATWELIVSIILLVAAGLLILFCLYIFVTSGIEVIKEIILVIQIRKEEREQKENE